MFTLSIRSFLCLYVILANFFPNLADNATPVVFIIGDSTADVGTNTFLPLSKIKADFPHYGVDFPNSRPTGRFSNGFNSADFLAKLFGLKRSPQPFLYLQGLETHHFHKHLFGGVNFASAGAGLLDTTNANQTIVPLSEQIAQFTSVQKNFTAMIGENATEAMLSKSLFFISIGSNDILVYFNSSVSGMPEDKFLDTLISTYSKYITTLYRLGARRFGIIGVSPVGCCPSQRVAQKKLNGVDGCLGPMNDFASSFQLALSTLLYNISSELPGMKYSLGNTYNMTLDVINNPGFSNFENVNASCCGFGYLNAEERCNKSAPLCHDRSKYLFWDLFHPTKAAANLAAQILYGGPQIYVSPITFSQLVEE